MKKDKTNWDNLTIKQKAELIKLYIKSGITELSKIKKGYNEYLQEDRVIGNRKTLVDRVVPNVDKAEYKNVDSSIEKYLEDKNMKNKFEDGGFISLLERAWNWAKDKANSYLDNNSNTSKNTIPKTNTSTTPIRLEDRLSMGRVRNNTSRTAASSEFIENVLHQEQLNKIKLARENGRSSDPYYITYDPKREISVDGYGTKTSIPILDSIALNAKKTGVPLSEALGLAYYETHFGALPNRSSTHGVDYDFGKKLGKSTIPLGANDSLKVDRAAYNSHFAKNYGGIEPSYLFNNHEWAVRGYKNKKELDTITHPMQHSLKIWQLGLFNPASSTHTKAVRKAGEGLMKNTNIKHWLENSKYAQEALAEEKKKK